MSISIAKLTFGRNASSLGIGQARPSISWRFKQDGQIVNWLQTDYELSLERDGKAQTHSVSSSDNLDIPWPKEEQPLRSRERVKVGVRCKGKGQWTDWYYETVEAGLLSDDDWSAKVVAPSVAQPSNLPKRPFHMRSTFTLDSTNGVARLYATALGVYQITINGQRIGDHVLAPGWQSYNHRLHYQVYAVPNGILKKGTNTIEALVGEGWYSGRLTWLDNCRNIWGDEIGVQAQLEVDGKSVVGTDDKWEWAFGRLLSSELYDGETFDAGTALTDWQSTKTLFFPSGTQLLAPEAPPIRRTEELTPKSLSVSPSGKKILDFGQNLVGWVKIRNIPKRARCNEAITLRFAEVLTKDGEMGIRPLRSAKATDRIFLGEEPVADWEPTFSFHGFRFCEVTGPSSVLEDWQADFAAVVIHSDMERLGDFECSHQLINQLHRNVVWGLKGNFVGLPTDCPQRDER